jgi:hypothetical protein
MQEPSLAEVQPGTIIFGPIGGFIPGVFPVGAGELLLKAATKETWKIRHVLVAIGDGTAVQAMPHGAERITLDAKHWTSEYIYVLPKYVQDQAGRVAEAALSLIGTPYSFLDYGALALHAIDPVWRIAPHATDSQPLARYIQSTGHMICSQLADECMKRADFHVFADGRLPQDVMPSALYTGLQKLGPQSVIIPG